MAEEIVTQIDATDPIVDAARRDLCLESVYELDKIARTLPGLVPRTEDQEFYLVKALAGRMLRLTSALMGALGDIDVPDKDIHRIVHFDEVASSQG